MVSPLPDDDCVFCNLEKHVKEYERYAYWHWNGYPIYRVVPLNPVTPGHVLFVPHQHIVEASAQPLLAGHVFAAAANYAREKQMAHYPADYNLITNGGEAATQTVFHMHVHYVPRQDGDRLDLPWDRSPCEGCG